MQKLNQKQTKISISAFGYENKNPYRNYISKQTFDKYVYLLLISNVRNLRYVLAKDFNRLMTNKKSIMEKDFYRYCLLCFRSSSMLQNHIKVYLAINHTKTVCGT